MCSYVVCTSERLAYLVDLPFHVERDAVRYRSMLTV